MKEISLTQGKIAFVDDEDYERVRQYKWYAHKVEAAKVYDEAAKIYFGEFAKLNVG